VSSACRAALQHTLQLLRDAARCVPRLDTALADKLPGGLPPLPQHGLFLKVQLTTSIQPQVTSLIQLAMQF
jgi:hypothetical protein